VPQSLQRTWVAIVLAAIAVLAVAGLTARDFIHDVYVPCPGTMNEEVAFDRSSGTMGALDPVSMESIASALPSTPSTGAAGPSFVLAYDQKQARGYGYPTEFKNVRIQWKVPGEAASWCTCGSLPIALSGEDPSDLRLFHGYPRQRGASRYVVKGRSRAGDTSSEVRAVFTIDPFATRHLQTDRIFTARHLPLGVVLLSIGALGVALLRSRRAISYARTIHAWTEARLTPERLLESESGAALGTVEVTRFGILPPGPVLVAPEALATSGLYRDVPIVTRRQVAEGTHARWAAGTMLRLRDAQALAVISTACTLLAFAARILA
jgi:hypothetical protein